MSVFFLIGSDSTYSHNTKQLLKEETKNHSDLIMADELVESYHNLTLKTLYTIKFFIETGLK